MSKKPPDIIEIAKLNDIHHRVTQRLINQLRKNKATTGEIQGATELFFWYWKEVKEELSA